MEISQGANPGSDITEVLWTPAAGMDASLRPSTPEVRGRIGMIIWHDGTQREGTMGLLYAVCCYTLRTSLCYLFIPMFLFNAVNAPKIDEVLLQRSDAYGVL